MSIRSTLLLAGAAVLVASAPAAAQDDRYRGLADPLPAMEDYAGDYVEGYSEEVVQQVDAEYQQDWRGDGADRRGQRDGRDRHDGRGGRGDHHGDRGGHHGDRHDGRHGGHQGRDDGPRFAYSAEERDQWLSDCQYLMADGGGYYEEDRDDDNGGLLGGLFGAVLGGVAGNRIADGDRLLGTVVGAGIGGLAGAAIGSVLDGDGDGELSRNEIWASRYCDAYLRRHELGGGEFAQGQQVVMVAAASGHGRGHDHGDNCRTCREVITEEWVEVEQVVSRPAPRPRPRPAPRPAPRPQGKLTPLG